MKKYLAISLVALLITTSFMSCKKESNTTQAKDYSASIKYKTWWGTLTNAGEGPQFYSVHFKPDNSLVWSQLSGDFAGKWAVEGSRLTLTFTAPAVVVTAEISEYNQLLNIVTSTANKVNSGQLVEDPAMDLDNTNWDGKFTGNQIFSVTWNFKGSSSVQTNTNPSPYNYQRSTGGGAFLFTYGSYPFFGVIVSKNEIRGNYNNYRTSFYATKK